MLQHCLPCRGSRGSVTLPHRLPLRSIPPPRFACGSSHSRGTWSSTVCAEEFPTPLEMSLHGLHLLGQSKSFGPSAPIAYATSVSPPDEVCCRPGRRCRSANDAAAWSGRSCWMQDMAATWPVRRSSKSPSTLPKCKYLITKELIFIAVRGGLNLCSPSTAAKVN